MKIDENWLMEVGGWKAMKTARSLARQGAVAGVSFDGRILRGEAREGRSRLACGLKITGPEEVTNLCSCAEARRFGALCPHSLAAGLLWIEAEKKAAEEPGTGSEWKGKGSGSASADASPVALEFPPNFLADLARGRLRLQAVPGNSESGSEELFAWLAPAGVTKFPSLISLNKPEQVTGLLQAASGAPELRFADQPAAAGIRIAADPLRRRLEISVEEDEVRVAFDDWGEILLGQSDGSGWVWIKESRLLAAVGPSMDLGDICESTHDLAWLVEYLPQMERLFDVSFAGDPPRILPLDPGIEFAFEGSLRMISGRPVAVYTDGAKRIELAAGEEISAADAGFPIMRGKRGSRRAQPGAGSGRRGPARSAGVHPGTRWRICPAGRRRDHRLPPLWSPRA